MKKCKSEQCLTQISENAPDYCPEHNELNMTLNTAIKRAWLNLKCHFGNHPDWELCETKKVRGWLFGQIVDAHRYKCTNCGHKGEFVVTESISMGEIIK